MALSGSTDFTLNRNEIIFAAMRKVKGVNCDYEVSEIETASQALNLIVKSLQNFNVFLWTSEWATKTLTASSVVTGTDGNTYTCIRPHTAATANKPVTGDDYQSYWVDGGSSPAVWAEGTAYTSVGVFDAESDTLTIDKAGYRDAYSDNPIRIVDKFTFLDIYDKTVTGTPTTLWFERSQSVARVWLWPIPDVTTYILNLQRIRKLQDFDGEEDNADFPERWLEFLIYQLAVKIAPEYGIGINERAALQAEANSLFAQAKRGNHEVQDDECVRSAY